MNFKKHIIFKSISMFLIVAHLAIFTCDNMAFAKIAESEPAAETMTAVPSGKEIAGSEIKDFQSTALEELGEFKKSDIKSSPGSEKKQISSQSLSLGSAATLSSTATASGTGYPPIAANFNISAIKNFVPDLYSGAATFSYPIVTPPGRMGVEPSLALFYSSQGSNGICGMGWDLSAGVIERSTKKGIPKYNSEDTFVFRSAGSSIELVSIGSNEYRPKIESAFMRFLFNGYSWEVTDRQGRKYIFGSVSESRIEYGSNTSGWYLDRVEDLSGNYMLIKYCKDSNQPYVNEINYTGYKGDSIFPSKVRFEYEDRQDWIQSFRSGFDVTIKKRLKNIIVEHSGALVRKYILNYTISNLTGRSLVSTISQYYSDGQLYLPPVSFKYAQKTDEPRWSLSGGWTMPSEAYFVAEDRRDMGIRLSDVNADGLMDLVKSYCYHNAYTGYFYGIKQTFLNNGQNGWNLSNDWVMPEYFIADRAATIADCGVRLFDVNSDGWADFVFSITGDDGAPPQSTRLSNKVDGWPTEASVWKMPDGVFFSRHTNWGNWPSPVLFLGVTLCDVNGDGQLDVVKDYGTDRQTYLNNGSGWTRSSIWTMPDGDLSNGSTTFAEVNGDGLLDIIICQGSNKKVYMNNGSGWSLSASWIIPPDIDLAAGDCQFFDVNSDGLSDVVKTPQSGEKKVYLNDSKGWSFNAGWSSFPGTVSDLGTRVEDVNGDGVVDVLTYYNNIPQVYLCSGPYPDLLQSIDNGIGGNAAASYVSYKGYNNSVQAEKGNLPFAIQVISEVVYNDGIGNSYPVRYQYDSAKFDFRDREFRGFGYVKTIDAEGGNSESWFNQDDIYKGKVYKQKVSDARGRLYSMVENHWASTEVKPGVNFVYLASMDNYIYDGDETFKQTRTLYEYDAFGNPTRVRNEGDTSQAGDEREVITEYVMNSERWLLGLPAHVIGKDSAGNKISEKWFYYDNHPNFSDSPELGRLTKESVWLYNPLTLSSSVLSTVYTYDSYGNFISATDPLNRTTTTTYDADYHIFPVKVTNALGQSIETTYDPKTGQVLTTKDLNNQMTSNIYDIVGRLSRVIGPNDSIEQPSVIYEYDLATRPIKLTTRNKVDYNLELDYLVSYSFLDGLGRTIQTRNSAEDDPIRHTSRQVVDGTVIFNSKGQVKEKYLPYFADSLSEFVVPDFSGPHATYVYDALGRLTQTINPDNTSSSTNYADWMVTHTDENGHFKTNYFDAYGNIIKVEEHNSGQTYTTTYNYDAQNNLIKITDNQNNKTQIWYDSLGRKIKMNDPDMGEWTYEYDAVGNLVQQTDNKGNILEFTYDALNRLTSKQAGGQTLATYVYDDKTKENCIGRLGYITDLSGRTDFYYDNLGREVKSEKTVAGVKYQVLREYDALDRLTTFTYPDNSVIKYTYNPQGIEQVKQIDPKTQMVEKYYILNIDYLATGQISRIEYGNETYTDYTYDPKTLRLTNLKTNGGALQDLGYQFDAVGNIAFIDDLTNGSAQEFQYDDLDRLIYANSNRYGTINYSYDSIGNLLSKGDSTLAYSGALAGVRPHAITSMTTPTNGTANFEYDANGNMSHRSNADSGEDIRYLYDSENRLIKVVPLSEQPIEEQSSSINITLYPGWNFVSLPFVPSSNFITDILGSLMLKEHYDQVSRFNATTQKFEHFVGNDQYDQFDNMEVGIGYEIFIINNTALNLSLEGVSISKNISIELKAGNNLIGYPYSVSRTVADVLKNLKQGIDYDIVKVYNKDDSFIALSQADPMQPGEVYVVHALKDCTLVFEPLTEPMQQLTTEFVYDGDGGRVQKIVTSHQSQVTNETTYIGSLYEVSGSLAKKHIFAGANRICSVDQQTSQPANQQTYFYHSDHLGSSNVITDDSGSVVQHLEYKPFGETALNEPANWPDGEPTNHKFTGKELDDSTGLYFYGARYYDAALGRFVTADPTIQKPYDPQDLNRYSYCRNNPINYTDPTGHSWKSFWKKVGDFFSNIGKGIAASPGAFVAGLAVGIFTAFAIGPMITGLHSAMLASGPGVTFWEGFVLGGMELGIPAFTGTLAGGLGGGEKFGTALKNAAIVGAATFVTAGLIEGAYTEGWQNWVHFQDTQTSNQLYSQAKDALKTGNFNAYSDFGSKLMDMNLTPPGAVLQGKSPLALGVKHSYLVAAKDAQVKAMGFGPAPGWQGAALKMPVPGMVRAESAATLAASKFRVLTWDLTKVTSVWGNMDKITMPVYELGEATRNCYGWTNKVLSESGLPTIDARDVW